MVGGVGVGLAEQRRTCELMPAFRLSLQPRTPLLLLLRPAANSQPKQKKRQTGERERVREGTVLRHNAQLREHGGRGWKGGVGGVGEVMTVPLPE